MIPHANRYAGLVPTEPTFGREAMDGYRTVGLNAPIRDAAAQQLATPREQFLNFFGAGTLLAKNPGNTANKPRGYDGVLPNTLLPILATPRPWLQAITGKGG